jgi:uncharacterized protein (TIGR03382 family)
MPGRNSLRLLGFAAGGLVLGILAACAAPSVPDSKGSSSAVSQRTFDRDNVLDDKSMRDSTAMTVGDVQKFLQKTPWGTKSALASYTENGKTAAQIMVETAVAHGINPLEMLVRVQMEQGLISKTTATTKITDIAFGCGCPSSPVCSAKYMGFANQADCAAGTLRRSMDKAITSTGTVSGWARSKAKDTEDGITITPVNAVTAALYTYTPYVGQAGGGKTGIGGVSLHGQVWDRFAEFTNYGAWAPATPTPPAPTDDADAAVEDPPVPPDPDPPVPPDPDPPTPDASTPDTGSEADSGTEPGSGSKGAPENGSEDGDILGGNSPPASNAPPPSTKKSTPSKPEDLTAATDAELAGKPKDEGGCSTTGQRGGDTGMLLAGAVALSLLVSRRRR